MAMRGHASIQGSTDIPTLYNLLPGYLPMPTSTSGKDLHTYLSSVKSAKHKGFWYYADTYMVSFLKEYWGAAATPENDFCFDYLPRINWDHGTYQTVMDMIDGKVFGYFLLGQNPAVGSAHGRLQRLGMAHLDWLVVRDLAMIECATFWKDSPEMASGEVVTEQCRTEVFFFPAASPYREGRERSPRRSECSNGERRRSTPAATARVDLDFFYHLGRRSRAAGGVDRRARPADLDLTWDYDRRGRASGRRRAAPDQRLPPHRPVSGRRLPGPQRRRRIDVRRVLDLHRRVRRRGQSGRRPHAAGSSRTISPGMGLGMAGQPADPLQPGFGRPGRQAVERTEEVLWWDEERAPWVGDDVPDFEQTAPPGFPPDPDARGPAALAGDDPFIMQSDGKGWLFAPPGWSDGPLPTHYEPQESPVANPLYAQQ